MKRILAIFLQVVIVLIAISAFTFMLWEPHFEGRNAGATLFEIYFKDLFLVYAYTASTLFFVALYQIFKILGHVGQNKLFSPHSMNALRIIKYCAVSIIGFVVLAEAYLFIFQRGKDDIAGGVAMGLFIILFSVIALVTAGVFEKILLRKGV